MSSTPGGGNVLGVANALSAALMLMSLRIAILKKNSGSKKYQNLEKRLLKIQETSLFLAEEDSVKFNEVMKLWKKGGNNLIKALIQSAKVSLKISKQSLLLLKLINVQEISKFSNIITDVGISVELAKAAFNGGIMNYRINIKGIKKGSIILKLAADKSKIESEFEQNYKEAIKKVTKYI